MLAAAGNVACKISGFGMADNSWTIASIRPWLSAPLHRRVRAGALHDRDELAGGHLFATYLEQVGAYRTIMARVGFSRADQERLLCRNAEKFYRI